MHRALPVVVLALSAAALCHRAADSSPDPARNPVPVPEGRYAGGPVADGGQVTGSVRLRGDLPALPPATIPPDLQTPCGHATIADESVILDPETGAVANAVVYLADIVRGALLPAAVTVSIDQRGCRFIPHVVVIPRGSTVRFLNSDPTLHNVHMTVAGSEWDANFGMPSGSPPHDISLRRPGLFQVGCDVHAWMRAYVISTNHPYYAVTGADGSFRIENVPAGEYTVRAWHERLLGAEGSVSVAAGAAATVTLALQP